MRVAIWYEGAALGRNDGNPLYTTAYLKRVQHFCDILDKRPLDEKLLNYFPNNPPSDPLAESFAHELHESGERIEIEHLRPNGKHLKEWGAFDLNIWVDWGEDALKGILPYDPIFPPARPLIYWASDTHLGFEYRFGCARLADHVFCAQKRAVEEFDKQGVKSTWLPHAFEPLAYPFSLRASKKYDVSFVGHINSENRIEALDRLYREFPNFFYGQRRFEAAANIYRNSKICFNRAMRDDLNMRVFEIMGSGGFLLTDDIPTIHELFEDGKHLVLYRSLDEMVEKARYYLEHTDEREKIARQGYEEVIKNHTIASRVRKMLSGCLKLQEA